MPDIDEVAVAAHTDDRAVENAALARPFIGAIFIQTTGAGAPGLFQKLDKGLSTNWIEVTAFDSALTVGNPGDWLTSPPITIVQAIDRLAAALKLLSGPVP